MMIRAKFILFTLAALSSQALGFGPIMSAGKHNAVFKVTNVGRPTGLVSNANAWVNGRFCMWGGRGSGVVVNTGSCYNSATQTWSAMAASPLTARNLMARAGIGSKFMVWGGRDYAGSTRYADGAVYDVSAGTWSMMAASPLAGVNGPAYASTGSKFLIWGGATSASVSTNAGAIYDPATNTWTSMTTTGAPPGATYALGAWTGSKFVVWGGFNQATSTAVGTGGVYDPATNTWATISATGAPTARNFHGVAASATKLAVFSGDSSLGGAGPLYSDGKIYDFAAGTWTAMSTVSAPGARRYFAFEFIPTLNRALLIGGMDLSVGHDDNYLFDLDNNRWTKIIPSGVPDGYDNNNCVWTGAQVFCNTTSPFFLAP